MNPTLVASLPGWASSVVPPLVDFSALVSLLPHAAVRNAKAAMRTARIRNFADRVRMGVASFQQGMGDELVASPVLLGWATWTGRGGPSRDRWAGRAPERVGPTRHRDGDTAGINRSGHPRRPS